MDGGAAQAVKDSLLLKCSYYDFEKLNDGQGHGYDLARMSNSPYTKNGIVLKDFEEAYTTSNWMVRIYRVKPLAGGENRLGRGGEVATRPQPLPGYTGRARRRRSQLTQAAVGTADGPQLFRRAPP